MLSRRTLTLAGISAAAVAAAARLAMTGSAHATSASKTFEVTKTDEEWKKLLTPEQFHVLRKHGTERAGTSPLDKQYGAGIYSCAGCDLPLFASEHQVRQRHRLAELLRAARQRHRHDQRPQLLHGAHRGALPALRRPSGPRVRRRPEADRPALLHERRRAEVHRREEVVL